VVDIISKMSFRQEQYCIKKKRISIQKKIPIIQTDASRLFMFEWMCEVADYYSYDHETVTIAISFYDRYKSTIMEPQIKIDGDFIALVALYLAVKLNERRERFIMEDFAYLSVGRYSEDDIERGEYELLDALSWLVHPITPQAFVRYLLHFLPNSISAKQYEKILRFSYFIIEITSLHEGFVTEKSVDIACASILVAIDVYSTFFSNQEQNLFVSRLESTNSIILDNATLFCSRIKIILKNRSLSVVAIMPMLHADGICPPNISDLLFKKTISTYFH